MSYDSLCSERRAIDASNGLQCANLRVSRGIEGRVGDVFVNTPKMFQSVMSVWCARPSDLGSDMWLAVVEIPSKQQNAPLFGTLEVAAPLSACY